MCQSRVHTIKDKKCLVLTRIMPTTEYKEPRTCACGYTTMNISLWSRHKRCCKLIPNEKDARIELLEQQLATKDEQIREQLAAKDEQISAKDEQIRELMQMAKKPRTVHNTTNNRYVVEQHINVFGKESLDHIKPEQIVSLLTDPANAVSRFIKLKHQKAPGGVNDNMRVPNKKRAVYQVVVKNEEGEKEWENRPKGEVLEQLYDDTSGHLEAEADEDTRVGLRFLDHQDKVKASADGEDGGRRYKEQLDKIHLVVSK